MRKTIERNSYSSTKTTASKRSKRKKKKKNGEFHTENKAEHFRKFLPTKSIFFRSNVMNDCRVRRQLSTSVMNSFDAIDSRFKCSAQSSASRNQRTKTETKFKRNVRKMIYHVFFNKLKTSLSTGSEVAASESEKI